MTYRLSEKHLGKCASGVVTPQYDRSSASCGVMHIGVGNFHRAHQAIYFDDLLASGELNWAITGVSLRSPKTRDALKPQDFLYTVATPGVTSTYRVVGALKDIIYAVEEFEKFLAKFRDLSLNIITVTVTEKGYCIKNGCIDIEHPHLAADLAGKNTPSAVYGFIAAGLVERAKSGQGKITIIGCDNVSGSGDLLREGVLEVLDRQCRAAADWTRESVSFVSSVVDRVVPATTEALVRDVTKNCGLSDEWPVAAEPFSQWIIEDRFKGKRPPLERSGVQFVRDVAPYERMKLQLLNATHTVAAATGFLLRVSDVHDVMLDASAGPFIRSFLLNAILPLVEVPDLVDGAEYAESILRRFANAHSPYGVQQVATDSSQKIAIRLFPTIDSMLAQRRRPPELIKALAIWLEYVRQAALSDTVNDLNADRLIEAVWARKSYEDLTQNLLEIAGAAKFKFVRDQVFMDMLVCEFETLVRRGIRQFVST